MWSDNVMAAVITSLVSLLGICLTLAVKNRELRRTRETSRVAAVEAGIADQITGWNTYSKSLRERIEELEGENERCNRRVSEIAQRLADSEMKCDALQDSVIELRRLVEQLRYEAQQRIQHRQEKEPPA